MDAFSQDSVGLNVIIAHFRNIRMLDNLNASIVFILFLSISVWVE